MPRTPELQTANRKRRKPVFQPNEPPVTDVPILRVLPDKLILAFCCDQLFLFWEGDHFWLCGYTTEDDVLDKKDLRSLNSRLNGSGRQFPSRGHRDDSQFDKGRCGIGPHRYFTNCQRTTL